MAASITLVDAMVVIYGHEQGWFEQLSKAAPLGVAGQVRREAQYFQDTGATDVPIDLGDAIASGRLLLVQATPPELAAFTNACDRGGLGSGEIESLALVMAHGYGFCTADVRAMRAMKDLGLDARWCPLEELFAAAGLDCAGLGAEYRRSAWP